MGKEFQGLPLCKTQQYCHY